MMFSNDEIKISNSNKSKDNKQNKKVLLIILTSNKLKKLKNYLEEFQILHIFHKTKMIKSRFKNICHDYFYLINFMK
jgi:prephenate dehydratase